MTLHEYNVSVQAIIKREHKLLAWQAWTIVALDRTKKLPSLPVFLGERRDPKELSDKILNVMSIQNERSKLLADSRNVARRDRRDRSVWPKSDTGTNEQIEGEVPSDSG